MSNRVLLWRHGQTDWNVANRFQGHSDIPLNEVGKAQAKHAAQVLAGMKPTMIISSDLERARFTAQELADLVNLEVGVTHLLRETNGGQWEGKTGAQNRADDLENFVRWIDGEDHPAGTTGERRSEVASRATQAINEALAGKDNQLLESQLMAVLRDVFLDISCNYQFHIGALLADYQMHHGQLFKQIHAVGI
jgi:probable phosphoglycerate mutase